MANSMKPLTADGAMLAAIIQLKWSLPPTDRRLPGLIAAQEAIQTARREFLDQQRAV